MLPLLLPTDPRLLAAMPGNPSRQHTTNEQKTLNALATRPRANSSQHSYSGVFEWHSQYKQVRKVKLDILNWIDGTNDATRWTQRSGPHDGKPLDMEDEESRWTEQDYSDRSSVVSDEYGAEPKTKAVHLTHLHRVPSRGRANRTSSTG
jgi:hypothetical protein